LIERAAFAVLGIVVAGGVVVFGKEARRKVYGKGVPQELTTSPCGDGICSQRAGLFGHFNIVV